MNASLPRTSPEMQGIPSSVILGFVEAAEQQIHELHSFMLVRHSSVVAEGWWSPYRADLPHMLFSLSKSFTSSAVGMAVAEGRLSIDDPVLSFFPDDAPAEVSANLAAMRVRHLLSMSTGHAEDATDHLHARQDGNWIREFLARPVAFEPGTHFVYNSGATYMLSAIVQKLSGMRLIDYLQPRLFAPLGIENATWEVSPQGINTGGWGLKIRTEDIARLGQLYLQKGVWNSQRLLPEAWIAQATARQISNQGLNPDIDWQQGYGFQFWRCRHNAYRGDGAFGQYCVVMPDQDAVLAITSGVADMQPLLDLVWDCLLPAFGSAALPADSAAQEALRRKLVSLALTPPQGRSTSPTAALVSGQTYKAEANPLNIEALSFDFGEAQAAVMLTVGGGSYRLNCGYGAWRASERWTFEVDSPVIASGVWSADDTFGLVYRLYETPFYWTTTFRFSGDHVVMELAPNVGFKVETHTISARAV